MGFRAAEPVRDDGRDARPRIRAVLGAPALAALTCSGCGRLGFDRIEPQRADAPPTAAASCEQAWVDGPILTAPQPVAGISLATSDQFAPFASFDGRTLYFGSTAGGDSDVHAAERSARGMPFGASSAVAGVNSAAEDTQLTLSADGLEAFLGSARGGQPDIWRATRGSTAAPWGMFSVLADVSSPAVEYNAILSFDELQLYFMAEDRAGGPGMADIWIATRPAREQPFTAPRPLEAINTMYKEASPSVTAMGRVIVFTSDRPGSIGSLDIWYATRASASEPFGAARLVPRINTVDTEYTPHLSSDGCELFFSAERSGDRDIHVTTVSSGT